MRRRITKTSSRVSNLNFSIEIYFHSAANAGAESFNSGNGHVGGLGGSAANAGGELHKLSSGCTNN